MVKGGFMIQLEIDGNQVTADWWTPEIKKLFCSLCEEKNCEPILCEISNPWCG